MLAPQSSVPNMVSIPNSKPLWFVSEEVSPDSESEVKEQRWKLRGSIHITACCMFSALNVLCIKSQKGYNFPSQIDKYCPPPKERKKIILWSWVKAVHESTSKDQKQARCVLCVVVTLMYVHVWEKETALQGSGKKKYRIKKVVEGRGNESRTGSRGLHF